jgi:hypothetical protein
MRHASPLIRFRKVYERHPGAGQTVTYCLDASHDADSEGFLVGVDVVPVLALIRADKHIAQHERDKALTP